MLHHHPSMSPFFLIFLLCPYFLLIQPTSSLTTITSFNTSSSPWLPTQDKLLLSPNSTFAAGFNPINKTSNLYTFSIWYYSISIVTPLWSIKTNLSLDNSSSLTITSSGGQLLLNSSSGNLPIASTPTSNSTQLTLSDDGNLEFGIWKSFDEPTHTWLPNQNFTGTLVSDNGRFSFDGKNLKFNKSNIYWSASSAIKSLTSVGQINLENGAIMSADFGDSPHRRLSLGDDGNLVLFSFNVEENQWKKVWEAVFELCKIHGSCGVNSICMSDGGDDTYCVCPPGFRPVSDGNYNCERKIELSTNTKFEPLDYVNFSAGSNQTKEQATNLSDCQTKCSTRPDCVGYMFKYDGSNYCVLLLDQLLYGYWSPGTETADVTFLRLDATEKDRSNFTGLTSLLETTCPVNISLPLPPDDSNTNARNIAIISTLFAAELISGLAFFWAFLKKYIKYRNMAQTLGLELLPAGGPKRFTYAEIKAATSDFSNPIGKGGFGDVYKGELSDKRVVAVKCLKNVAGGDGEFWAEVTIIARMHHLNLVRLWGFCAEKGQRILVYEYVPNGSLDKYLFRSSRSSMEHEEMGEVAGERKPVLDWGVRYRIALGVARAIAYLHEECLEWVLHCDIKPENILLGDDFCPKISDFGLAKLRKKEGVVSMSRMRGTRGYMAPEWVKTDQITPKADVYSFGMVLLELVSGVRNFEMQGSLMDSVDWYLPGWAFDKAFKEMKVEDILDRQIKHAYDHKVHFKLVDRMVKTAMWCLQDRPELRPSMGKVAKMLEGTVEIMEPKKPTIFYLGDE